MLLDKSPEYWAREATLGELQDEVRALREFDEPTAELLDFAYVDRCMRTLGRTHGGFRDAALALADHLERVAHDSVREQLDRLERPYFARWRLLSELLNRAAARGEVPRQILGRRHVREILLQLHHAGKPVDQSKLKQPSNEGQRSVTLKLMEQWDLITRQTNGQTRLVSITDLGRLAIKDDIAGSTTAPPARARVPRGCCMT